MQLFSFLESTEQSAESWSVFEPVLIVLVVYSPFNQVRFSRPESEQARQRRIQSYEFLQKKQAEEPWVHLHYHGVKVCVIMWPTAAHLTDASEHNVNHIKQKHYICIVFSAQKSLWLWLCSWNHSKLRLSVWKWRTSDIYILTLELVV